MKWGAVVVAAGRGARFGGPKQLVELAGVPMVAWSIRTFASMPEIERIVIVTEEEWIEPMRGLVESFAPNHGAIVVRGGATRQASVRCGMDAMPAACDALLVHDGARPLVRPDDVRAGMQVVQMGRGAVLAAPVVDTIKVVDPSTMLVKATLDRRELWSAQTPQFALRGDLERAHAHAERSGMEATDDVALLEAIGVDVIVVPASAENFKVTHPHDVARAQVLLRERLESPVSS